MNDENVILGEPIEPEESEDHVESLDQEDSEVESDEEIFTQYVVTDPIDYTGYFENLQTIGILICSLLVAYGVAFAFFKGLKR